jgi:hypothetical protein
MSVKIQVLAWNRHTHVAELTRLIGHNPTLLITVIPTAIRIYKRLKPLPIRFQQKRPHYYLKNG